jgi:hypothetical protein
MSKLKNLAAHIIQSSARKFLYKKKSEKRKKQREKSKQLKKMFADSERYMNMSTNPFLQDFNKVLFSRKRAAKKIQRSFRKFQATKKEIDLRDYVKRCTYDKKKKPLTIEDLQIVDYKGRTFLHYLADEHRTLKRPEFKDYEPKEPDFYQCLEFVADLFKDCKDINDNTLSMWSLGVYLDVDAAKRKKKVAIELLNMKDKQGHTPFSLAILNMPYEYDKEHFNYNQLFNKNRNGNNNHGRFSFTRSKILIFCYDFLPFMKKKTFDDAYLLYTNNVLPKIKNRYTDYPNFEMPMKNILKYNYSKLIKTKEEIEEEEELRRLQREAEEKEYLKEKQFLKDNPCRSDNLRNGGRGHCSPDMKCPWCADPKNRKTF